MKRMWSKNELKNIADARVQALVEGGALDNAKPIFCHPISIQGTSDNENYKIKIALLIFDNSNEQYNTLEKLTTKLNSIFALNVSAVFPITGGLFNTTDSRLHIAQKIDKEGEQINIRTLRSDGNEGYFSLASFSGATYYDGVNKIN